MSEARLSLEEDGRYAYRTKRGVTLHLTAVQLVKRLVALVPPHGLHLAVYHGVFAPNARARAQVVRPPPAPVPPPAVALLAPVAGVFPPPAAAPASSDGTWRPLPPRPRLNWADLQRRTFEADVRRCPCGGVRRVLTCVTSRASAQEWLARLESRGRAGAGALARGA